MPHDANQRIAGSNAIARLQQLRDNDLGQFIPVILSLAVIWTFFSLSEPAFLTPRNLYFLLMQSAVVATLAVGVTMVLLIGDIDLSIAAVSGVSAALLAVVVTKLGMPPSIACLAALGAGLALGFFQGWIIAYVGIPSFVVTLAGLLGFQGLMLKILGKHGAVNMREPAIRALTTVNIPSWLGWLLAAVLIITATALLLRQNHQRSRRGLERLQTAPLVARIILFSAFIAIAVATLNAYRGVPVLMLFLGVIFIFLWWLTSATPFGRYLFAIGGNVESARRVGIPVRRMRLAAFTIVGLMAAVGGIIGASRYASVSFNAFAGGPLLLEAIGAAVIGGTSLFGGRGNVWNAVLGALVIGSLGNGLDLSGASAADKLMVSGAILLLAVAFDALTRRAQAQ